jgi:hypothetical protein
MASEGNRMRQVRGLTTVSLLALAAGALGVAGGVAQIVNGTLVTQPFAITSGLLHSLNGANGSGGAINPAMLSTLVGVAYLAFGLGARLRRAWAWGFGVTLQWVVLIETVVFMALDGVTPLRFASFTLAVALLLYLHGADARDALAATRAPM